MLRFSSARILPVLFFVAACGAVDVPVGGGNDNLPGAGGDASDLPEDGVDAIELCDAADYRDLVGTQATATTFPTGPRLRVFGVDDLVTQEYLPIRTNVVFDRGGKIIRVWCG